MVSFRFSTSASRSRSRFSASAARLLAASSIAFSAATSICKSQIAWGGNLAIQYSRYVSYLGANQVSVHAAVEACKCHRLRQWVLGAWRRQAHVRHSFDLPNCREDLVGFRKFDTALQSLACQIALRLPSWFATGTSHTMPCGASGLRQ